MSYPKDPYYEKPPVGGSSYYPNAQHMGQPEPGQYLPPSYPNAPPPYSAVSPAMPGSAVPPYQQGQYSYGAGVPPQSHGQHYGLPGSMPGSAPPPYTGYGQPNYNPGYPVQQNFNYAAPPMAVAQFDSGARFDGIASPKIPPPPPGCAPNAAQMAAAQGGTVVASQKKAGWFSGTGGGVSFW